jgi:hypothetical protein
MRCEAYLTTHRCEQEAGHDDRVAHTAFVQLFDFRRAQYERAYITWTWESEGTLSAAEISGGG